MEKEWILVIDSGLGGISVLNECIKLMPHENFLYVADNKNASYGNKSKRKIEKQVLRLVERVVNKHKIKLVLFACNTITATAIEYVRSNINLPIVGIEPAIKPALNNQTNNILLLSTVATLKHNNLLIKIKEQNRSNVYFLPLKQMAKKIDKNLNNLININPYVNKVLKKYKNKNINSVVLGCTHYYYIKNAIKQALNSNEIDFFESNLGTAKRVKDLLNKSNNSRLL